MTQPEVSVLHDVLRVYDRRFLDLDGDQRQRLLQGTRQVLGDGLSDEVRAALPSAYRLRAFCIQHELHDELERLVRDEADGRREGAVVVGGRVYAVYPYLRGVPRQDADITGEIEVAHRLDAAGWHGGRLRLRGWAAIERIETRKMTVELILREQASGEEHRFPTEPYETGFEALIELTDLAEGHWDTHAAVTALGVTREARLGTVHGPKLKADPLNRTVSGKALTAYYTGDGHLAIEISLNPTRPIPLTKLRRRLFH